MRAKSKRLVCYLLFLLFVVGQVGCSKAAQADGEDVGKLTQEYFIPSLKSQYIYRVSYGPTEVDEEEITISWKKLAKKRYQEKGDFADGFGNALYEVDDQGIKLIQLESGYYESESSLDVTQKGDAYEFKFVTPGSQWVNNYEAADNGNVSREYDEYNFVGFESIEVMGKEMEAAHVTWENDSEVIAETLDKPLSKVSGKTKGHIWFVKGLGLVKTSSESLYDDHSSSFSQELVEVK